MSGDGELRTYHHAVIWANGFDVAESILELLDAHPSLEISHIELKSYRSARAMVGEVYAFESAPVKHLLSKTRYLRKFETKALHLVLEKRGIEFASEKISGEVAIFDPTMRKIKWDIREIHNPRNPIGELQHEHVLHVSDSWHLAIQSLYLSLGTKAELILEQERMGRLGLSIPWHLKDISNVNLALVPVADLVARILTPGGTRILPLAETPHYLSAANEEFEEYRRYLSANRGVGLTDWYSVQKFQTILSSYDPEVFSPIIVKPIEHQDQPKFLILDGLHRAVAHGLQSRDSIVSAVVGAEDD